MKLQLNGWMTPNVPDAVSTLNSFIWYGIIGTLVAGLTFGLASHAEGDEDIGGNMTIAMLAGLVWPLTLLVVVVYVIGRLVKRIFAAIDN